jgi:cardiolipin synthase
MVRGATVLASSRYGKFLSKPNSNSPNTSSAFSIESIQKIFGQTFSTATHVQLLWKGEDTFKTLFNAIEGAKRFICLQFYIFRDDDTGRAFSALLKKKAEEGVNVYILYDHFGSLGTPGRFWQEMKGAGIKVRASYPFKWTAPLHYVHRDHRKLIVIDGKEAFTGGLNIANEYSGFHLRKRREGWRDTGILLQGPIVKELFETFKRSWHQWGGGKIPLPKTDSISNKGKADISMDPPGPNGDRILPVLPIFVYSKKGRRKMRSLLRYSVDHAASTIFLTTAYFTPSRSMIAALEDAVKRRVRVRLLVPGQSDIPPASYAGKAFFSRLLKSGVEIFTYEGEMLHAKTYVFDQRWSIIGSTNLDYQSLLYNDEGNVGILDTGVGEKMNEMFEADLKYSVSIDLKTWSRRPFFEKIKEHFFALFRKRL